MTLSGSFSAQIGGVPPAPPPPPLPPAVPGSAAAQGGPSAPDPLSTFAFGVSIDSVVNAYFTECTGLQVSMTPYTIKEGGLNYPHRFPSRVEYGQVTLKWGLAETTALWDWFQKTMDATTTPKASRGSAKHRRSISIVQFDRQTKSPARLWNLIGAFPVKWVGPSFNAGQSQVAIESVEIAYEYFDAPRPSRG